MKTGKEKRAVAMLLSSMIVFGTIGLFRRLIPLGSATLAAARGAIGVATIALIMLLTGRRPDMRAIRENFVRLVVSGAFIGINWILLFEAYERTTIAVATLCYYTAPIFALLGAALFLRERLTTRKIFCILAATVGMIGVSGVLSGDAAPNPGGVLFGLAAAVLYACVVIINQKITGVAAYDKTAVQLLCAAIVVAPYALLVERTDVAAITPDVIALVALVGVLHTGVAYALYFASMDAVTTQTVALLGYTDPLVAILVSVLFLHEPLGIFEIIGMIFIFGATIVGELPARGEK